jgi:hypothetical protein
VLARLCPSPPSPKELAQGEARPRFLEGIRPLAVLFQRVK